MANSINNAAARKAWGSELQVVVPQRSFFYTREFVKPSTEADSAVIIEMQELMKPRNGDGVASGYEITFDLDGHIDGYTTPGDTPIVGDESDIKRFTDKIQINQERKSVISPGKFNEQLDPFPFRQRGLNRSAGYWQRWFDERIIAKLSGSLGSGTWFTIDTTKATSSARDIKGSVASDGNDLRSPSTNRIIYGNARANQAAITTSDTMSYDIIDEALMLAVRPEANTTTNRLVEPLLIDGIETYILLMDYIQAKQMGQDTSGRHWDIQKAMLQGGYKDSKLLRGGMGVYASSVGVNVILYSHPKMVKFSAAATGGEKVIRALLLGKGAGRVAYGRESKKLPNYDWQEETADRGNKLVITSGNTVGIQKSAYLTTETGATREDWGVIAVDTYGNW